MRRTIATLINLSHELGREDRQLAILGEGNTSTRIDSETFIVKASGSSLGTLKAGGLTACRFDGLLALLTRAKMRDAAIDEALLSARTDPSAGKPSTEAVFHAWLLTLPGVNFVGHTHPVSVNSLLCSGHGRTFARRRMFPDEIVCGGDESVLVPYTDPGLKLAQAIRRETKAFVRRRGSIPRMILLENHGLIALGGSPRAVLATTLMADKAARIFLGAAAIGKPRFLTPAQVTRIAGRPDERHRQKILGL
ncbi:MAG TPA: class II aldolase/adducin family protein [Opitutaceae bacterium]|nr:class II aldolase/adducin family protein [Opitutaceae bacterium]